VQVIWKGRESMTTTTTRKVTVRCPFCVTLNRVDLNKLANGPKCGGCGKPLQLDRPIKSTGADFDQTISTAEVPVLVDFYADWCGPCKMVAPVVDEVAQARAGKAVVLKVDTDRFPGINQRFGIRGIPTLIAFRGGNETGRHVGLAKRAELEALLTAAP
jgi:thioredoxin 2